MALVHTQNNMIHNIYKNLLQDSANSEKCFFQPNLLLEVDPPLFPGELDKYPFHFIQFPLTLVNIMLASPNTKLLDYYCIRVAIIFLDLLAGTINTFI